MFVINGSMEEVTAHLERVYFCLCLCLCLCLTHSLSLSVCVCAACTPVTAIRLEEVTAHLERVYFRLQRECLVRSPGSTVYCILYTIYYILSCLFRSKERRRGEGGRGREREGAGGRGREREGERERGNFGSHTTQHRQDTHTHTHTQTHTHTHTHTQITDVLTDTGMANLFPEVLVRLGADRGGDTDKVTLNILKSLSLGIFPYRTIVQKEPFQNIVH